MHDKKFSSRLDIVIDKLGGAGKACDAANISYPTLGRWKAGSSEPLMKSISILAKHANVSLDWLIYGEEKTAEIKTKKNTEYVYIPFYHTEASAGHGSFLSQEQENPVHTLAFRQRWATANGFNSESLVGLITKGDSMEPTIHAGAAIVINKDANKASDGNIYVIRISDRLWVKRTQWLPDGGLKLISDNKSYDAMSLSKDDFQSNNVEVIGQVVHTAYDLNK